MEFIVNMELGALPVMAAFPQGSVNEFLRGLCSLFKHKIPTTGSQVSGSYASPINLL